MNLSKVRKMVYQFNFDLKDQDIGRLESRGIIASAYFVESKSTVDIFKVSTSRHINFHIGNFYEDDDRVFYEFQAYLSNGVVIRRTFWNFCLIPLMSVDDLKLWKKPRKISIILGVGMYDGEGSASEWQNVLTSINDFTPVCTQMTFHSESMENLLTSGFHADVTFNFPTGETLLAHKCLLSASSPYFRALFRGNFEKSNEDIIRVEFEYNLMKVMVLFLYSGQVDEDKVENWPDMYRIAQFYNVEMLANHSELQMMVGSPRDAEGIKEILKFAVKYQAKRLKRFMILLMRSIQETKETKLFNGYYLL